MAHDIDVLDAVGLRSASRGAGALAAARIAAVNQVQVRIAFNLVDMGFGLVGDQRRVSRRRRRKLEALINVAGNVGRFAVIGIPAVAPEPLIAVSGDRGAVAILVDVDDVVLGRELEVDFGILGQRGKNVGGLVFDG